AVAAAAGEELVGAGPEALAAEGGATGPAALGGDVRGPARERPGDHLRGTTSRGWCRTSAARTPNRSPTCTTASGRACRSSSARRRGTTGLWLPNWRSLEGRPRPTDAAILRRASLPLGRTTTTAREQPPSRPFALPTSACRHF